MGGLRLQDLDWPDGPDRSPGAALCSKRCPKPTERACWVLEIKAKDLESLPVISKHLDRGLMCTASHAVLPACSSYTSS